MNEKPAEGVEGFLLYDFDTDKHFFRVEHGTNPETGKHEFTDYELCAEDIKITITGKHISLFEPEKDKNKFKRGKVGWASSFLNRGKILLAAELKKKST